MIKVSLGGMDAARSVYRHALVRLISPLLAPLAASRGAGWSPRTLAIASVLMGWDAGPTLAQRFESALAVLDAAVARRRRVPRTFQGFVKALARHGDAALALLGVHLRTLTRQAAGRSWSIGALIPIGVDGSRIDAPRTIANEALGMAGKDKCGPQMLLLLLVHLGAMLPWAWTIGGARDSERALLRRVLDLLPENTLLIADAGFTGFDLLSELRRRGVHFLVRVGRGTSLLRQLGHARHEGASTVYLWPDQKKSRPPLTLRLIRVGSVCLITDITDPRVLSKAAASEFYRRRWGLEVAFRAFKQTLARRKVRSGAPGNARMELAWSVIGLWTLALLGVRALATAGHCPRALSLAAALSAVRAARLRATADRTLKKRLSRAVHDGYRRRGKKHAYRWPHKKNPAPPGAPTLTTASPRQIHAAARLRSPAHNA
jgi:hypothetical protein